MSPPGTDDDSERANVHAGIFSRKDEGQLLKFTPGFASVGWQRIDHEKLDGGPVRRWHVYDYTIAAVTIAWRRARELTIPDYG